MMSILGANCPMGCTLNGKSLDLTSALDILNQKLYSLGLGTAAIHTGPVIRQEEIYNAIDLDTRRKIMRVLLTF